MTTHASVRAGVAAACVTASLLLGTVTVPVIAPGEVAQAVTSSDIASAKSQAQSSAEREATLRSQLSGVNAQLAEKIVELDDLTNNKIPAAQKAVTAANDAAAAAKDEAAAARQRLNAAQKDEESLRRQIKKSGEDYDDARAAVAQVARDDMHGSTASDIISIVVGSTSTQDFIQSMQSRDALARNESNAASDAATTLNISMNRGERLKAIEKEVAQLKKAADRRSQAAQEAADAAKAKRNALDKLRQQGEAKRKELSAASGQLNSSVARQAAQTVLLESQLDSYNRQWAAQQAAAAATVSSGEQQASSVSSSSSSSSSSSGTTGGQGTSNGDNGNGYVGGQCTYWAYERRKQLGIGTPLHLGNGGDWWRNAPAYGLRVDHTPQVGAAISFLPGQAGAAAVYGHVAVVEQVLSGDTIRISEMNAVGEWIVSYRIISNASLYWYVH